MKLRILSLLLSVFCAVSLISFTGCGKAKAEVYFLNFKPESAAIYEEIAKKYNSEIINFISKIEYLWKRK